MNTFIYTQTDGGIDTRQDFITPAITCSYCNKQNPSTFISGYNTTGTWCNMCEHCHSIHGNGLGILHGQRYEFKALINRAN